MFLHLKLRHFETILERRLNRYLKMRTGLENLELAILVTASEDSRSQIEIAKRLGLHRNVMTQVVRKLERLGYVERKADPTDRRRFIMQPTPAGLSVVRRIKRNNVQLHRLVLHPLSNEQIEQLDEIMTKLVEGMADTEVLAELEGLGSRLSSAPHAKAARTSAS